jgi:hypothetical protein
MQYNSFCVACILVSWHANTLQSLDEFCATHSVMVQIVSSQLSWSSSTHFANETVAN